MTKYPIPNYFGTVYLINLMYFFTNGEIPIYDQYAFRALKALMLNKKPWEVFVSTDNPDKLDKNSVFGLIDEYIWYMDSLFGKHNIDRKLDRALWVYGHLKEENKGIIDENGLYIKHNEVREDELIVNPVGTVGISV